MAIAKKPAPKPTKKQKAESFAAGPKNGDDKTTSTIVIRMRKSLLERIDAQIQNQVEENDGNFISRNSFIVSLLAEGVKALESEGN